MTLDLHEVQLAGLQTFEATGRRRDGFLEDPPLEETDGMPELSILIRVRGETGFDLRFRVEFVTSEAYLAADIAASYSTPELSEPPDQESLSDFARTSGMLHIYPFLRESLFSTATRLQVDPPLLPMAAPGVAQIKGLEAAD